MSNRSFFQCGISIAALLTSTAASWAMSAEDFAQVSLLQGWRSDNGTHIAAIKIELAQGWHTYWRKPGDAGIPPQLDFSGSRNVEDVRIHWPIPEVFNIDGLTSIGYKDVVIFPLEVALQTSGKANLNAELLIGVCEEVCIPMEVSLSGLLVDTTVLDADIKRSLASKPSAGKGHVTCKAAPIADGLSLELQFPKTYGKDANFAIETADPTIWVSRPDISQTDRGTLAVADLVPLDAAPFAMDRSGLRVTVFQDGQAVEYQGCKAPA